MFSFGLDTSLLQWEARFRHSDDPRGYKDFHQLPVELKAPYGFAALRLALVEPPCSYQTLAFQKSWQAVC